ncbi:hypothetical protein [Paenibacillus sp. VMFN-D1]|uniref:hypothetical protein n=1 Tax=Paenibacillus sp. VMFN-D1 TaxID=2135608 RepID=UPI000E281EFE|nr:hypothetical protein [Paenibacillus sp. VMFN-D1]
MSLLKSVSFWLTLFAILTCILDSSGQGMANIILIRLNPLLEALLHDPVYSGWLSDKHAFVTNSYFIPLRFPAYLLSIVMAIIIGAAIDLLIYGIKRGLARRGHPRSTL